MFECILFIAEPEASSSDVPAERGLDDGTAATPFGDDGKLLYINRDSGEAISFSPPFFIVDYIALNHRTIAVGRQPHLRARRLVDSGSSRCHLTVGNVDSPGAGLASARDQ